MKNVKFKDDLEDWEFGDIKGMTQIKKVGRNIEKLFEAIEKEVDRLKYYGDWEDLNGLCAQAVRTYMKHVCFDIWFSEKKEFSFNVYNKECLDEIVADIKVGKLFDECFDREEEDWEGAVSILKEDRRDTLADLLAQKKFFEKYSKRIAKQIKKIESLPLHPAEVET